MSDPISIVEAFLRECGRGKEAMQQAFRSYFTPESVWENVGIATTVGASEAIHFAAQFEMASGVATWDAEMLAIAATGNRVLTERIDHLLTPEGDRVMALRVMGIFEVEGAAITAWRDYLDTAGLKALQSTLKPVASSAVKNTKT